MKFLQSNKPIASPIGGRPYSAAVASTSVEVLRLRSRTPGTAPVQRPSSKVTAPLSSV
jgi:hypothetical protein